MSIECKKNIFYLNTPNTSYIFGLYKEKLLMHLYYGNKISSEIELERSIPVRIMRDGVAMPEFPDDATDGAAPMEYSTFGSCDLREPAIHICYNDGSTVSKFEFVNYKIYKGKPKLNDLPSSYVESDEEADTLELYLFDSLKKIMLVLTYTVYNTCDIITKSVKVINNSDEKCRIERLLSSCFDMPNDNYEMLTLNGGWTRECHINRSTVFQGYIGVDSKRGASSHQHNPFFALVEKNTDESRGKAYGFALVYSGNFKAAIEMDDADLVRTMIGINDFNFGWVLNTNEEFQSPEAVLTFSNKGIGGMSRTFNKFIRTRVCRGKFRDKRRPVLINNWEATYFDFNEDKIIYIAKKAKEAGVELLVLDDGWFGKRNDDTTSLGDWFANTEKLPCGIKGLAEKINDEGLKFGLWFEPEMVSKDSELYKKHPDWCIHTNGRFRSNSRNQLTLDLSRTEVCDYIIDIFTKNLGSANIEYVKWDMNRSMSEVGSALLAPENQQEVYHRYMLGLYRVLDTIMSRFPNVLFEGCASGGGRFDMGMLCYFSQIWTSDNSDAVERMFIQYGTSLVYPNSAMAAHVSAVPNHQVNRVTPLKTRADVAMMGAFGYELDLNTLSEAEFKQIKEQIEYYKKYSSIMQKAELYRLKSPYNSNFTSFELVSEDKNFVFLLFANILGESNTKVYSVKLEGIEDNALYIDEKTGELYKGDFLKNIGLFFKNDKGDFVTNMLTLKKVQE